MIGWRATFFSALSYSMIVAPAAVVDDAAAGCAHSVQSIQPVQDLQRVQANRDDCNRLATLPVATEEEYTLGGSVAVRIVGATGLIVDDASTANSPKNRLTEYLNQVGKNLGAQSSRPTYRWVFSVVEDKGNPRMDAFSTPGGYVFVTRTLLKRIDNEAQLAAVLAHEISHVTERHAIHVYQQVKARQCDYAAAGAAANALVGGEAKAMLDSLSNGVLNLDDLGNAKLLDDLTEKMADAFSGGYEKQLELDADRIGAELLLTAGYNPYEMLALLHRLPDASFSNHPPHLEREQQLREWLTRYCAPGSSAPLLAADCPFKSYPVVPLPHDIKKILADL
jgi:predicted Zn-dependent protease